MALVACRRRRSQCLLELREDVDHMSHGTVRNYLSNAKDKLDDDPAEDGAASSRPAADQSWRQVGRPSASHATLICLAASGSSQVSGSVTCRRSMRSQPGGGLRCPPRSELGSGRGRSVAKG